MTATKHVIVLHRTRFTRMTSRRPWQVSCVSLHSRSSDPESESKWIRVCDYTIKYRACGAPEVQTLFCLEWILCLLCDERSRFNCLKR